MTYLAENFEMNGISTLLIPWNIRLSLFKTIIDSLKPQAVLFPHARTTAEHIFDFLSTKQTQVFIHDTEGWMYRRRIVSYLNNEFTSKIVTRCAGYFVWGEDFAERIKGKFGSNCKLTVSGSVRLEAFSRLKEFRQPSNKKLLVATTCEKPYPRFQSASSELKLFVRDLGYSLDDYLKEYNVQLKNQERLFTTTSKIRSLYPDLKIAIRPHPFASLDAISECLTEYGIDAELSLEMASYEDLMDTTVLLHGGSTISLEAYALGIPSITSSSLLGIPKELMDHQGFTTYAEDLIDVNNKLAEIIKTPEKYIIENKSDSPYLREIGKEPSPSSIITKIIKDRIADSPKSSRSLSNLKLGIPDFSRPNALGGYLSKYKDKVFNQTDLDKLNPYLSSLFPMRGSLRNSFSVLYSKDDNVPLMANWKKLIN